MGVVWTTIASKFPVGERVITTGPGVVRALPAPAPAPPPAIVTPPGLPGPRLPGKPEAEDAVGEPAGEPNAEPEPTADEDPNALEPEGLLDSDPLARGFVSALADPVGSPAPVPALAPSPDICAIFPGGTTSRSVMGMLRSFNDRILTGSPTDIGGGKSGASRVGGASSGGGVRGSGSRARKLVGWGSAWTISRGAGTFSTGTESGGLGRPGAMNDFASLGIWVDKIRKFGKGVAGGTRSGGESG